jgi:hypothetical protein
VIRRELLDAARWDRLARRSFTSSAPARFFTPRFVIGATLFVLAMMVWRALRVYPTGVFDFYPLYFGGQAWLQSGDAYNLDIVIPPDRRDFQLFQIGNVYPFPAVLVTLPFSFLPPQVAAVLWTGLLSTGVVLALRLHNWPYWYLFGLPIVEGLRIEQYTTFIVIVQMIALWAWRERRPWLLALCCVVALTKPNHALFFVIMLTFLAKNWYPLIVQGLAFFGLSFALYPTWVFDWIPRLENHHAILHQPFLWQVALLAIPVFLIGDIITGTLLLQFIMMPFPGIYAAAAVPLGVLGDRRSYWLVLIGILALFFVPFVSVAWVVFLTVALPTVGLALWRWRARRQLAIPAATAPEPRWVGETA